MEECKLLDTSIELCQSIRKSLETSINQVRRLNMRYNPEWCVENQTEYLDNMWSDYKALCDSAKGVSASATMPTITEESPGDTVNDLEDKTVPEPRTSQELNETNCKINYKFLKVKRGMEGVLNQYQRTMEIANRQTDSTMALKQYESDDKP